MSNPSPRDNTHTPVLTPNPTRFQNQVVIVTGAAAGIGRETAELFAQQAAQMILFDVNEEGLANVQSFLSDDGLEADIRKCDISNGEDVKESIEWVMTKYGKIDILVNLAGIYGFDNLVGYSSELFHRHMNINVNGSFYLTRAVLPYMQNAGYGRIIHTSSTTYANPKPGLSAYIMSKAAVIGLVRSAAVEAGPGVTVNAVMPGLIDTETMRSVDGFEELAGNVIGNQAVKRQGRAIDIAQAISFIASSEAGFFSGQVFNCSGGETFSF